MACRWGGRAGGGTMSLFNCRLDTSIALLSRDTPQPLPGKLRHKGMDVSPNMPMVPRLQALKALRVGLLNRRGSGYLEHRALVLKPLCHWTSNDQHEPKQAMCETSLHPILQYNVRLSKLGMIQSTAAEHWSRIPSLSNAWHSCGTLSSTPARGTLESCLAWLS